MGERTPDRRRCCRRRARARGSASRHRRHRGASAHAGTRARSWPRRSRARRTSVALPRRRDRRRIAVSTTGARSMFTPSARIADATGATCTAIRSGDHCARISRGHGNAPVSAARRWMPPPSSSLANHGFTAACRRSDVSAAVRPGPEPADGWPKKTSPPAPSRTTAADAAGAMYCAPTMSSCATRRWGVQPDSAGCVVVVGGCVVGVAGTSCSCSKRSARARRRIRHCTRRASAPRRRSTGPAQPGR